MPIPAAALHAFTRMVRCTGLAHADVTALIDHLWSWPCIGPDGFDAWYAFDSPVLLMSPNEEFTSDLPQECRRVRVDPADLRQLLEHTAEIVYGRLFSRPDNAESLAHLATVETIAWRYGVTLPPGTLFAGSPWSARHGCGPKMLPTDVDRWCALTWPASE